MNRYKDKKLLKGILCVVITIITWLIILLIACGYRKYDIEAGANAISGMIYFGLIMNTCLIGFILDKFDKERE